MILSEKHYITKGTRRAIYIHPTDSSLCIKIPNKITRETKREIKYINRHKKNFLFLSFFHEEIKTNLGTGYVFDLIRNRDGSISKTLFEENQRGEIPLLKEKLLLLYKALLENGAAVADFHYKNIVVRWKDKRDYDLFIIDGFGNSDFIKICNFSKFFLLKKLNRKFNKLANSLDIPINL